MQINTASYCTFSIGFRFALIMKLSSNTFAKRKAVVLVLLAWLFALASGVANACLLETHTTHANVVSAASNNALVLAVLAGHTKEAVADDDHESPSAKAPCLKVCDDSSNALVSQPSQAQADTGPAPLVRIIWLVAVADRKTPFKPGDPWPSATKLPLRLRYARLAL